MQIDQLWGTHSGGDACCTWPVVTAWREHGAGWQGGEPCSYRVIEAGAGSVHTAWRMAVAERAAAEYAGNGKLAALAVAGSVGAGLADRFSDLELDCYWSSPPSDADRTGPIGALGGELTDLWDYDESDREWSEDYLLGDLGVTVSNFTIGTIEQFVDDVVRRADTDPVKHMRLAALQRSRPLLGGDLITSWRARADRFPHELATALVQQALAEKVLTGWAARNALAARGDDLAARDLLTRAGQAVVQAILAVNRVYLPHRQLKWQRHLLSGLAADPDRLTDRLEAMTASPPAEAFPAAETLLEDTVLLAEARTGANLSAFRQAMAERRQPLDHPLPANDCSPQAAQPRGDAYRHCTEHPFGTHEMITSALTQPPVTADTCAFPCRLCERPGRWVQLVTPSLRKILRR